MKPINIMINGLPGQVAGVIAGHALSDSRVNLLPYSLTGPEITDSHCTIKNTAFELISPQNRNDRLTAIGEKHNDFISIDFTHPAAVNDNADFYCRKCLAFVMGTTGGDRQALVHTVRKSDTCAIIAPNMAKQIVGFQAMMAYAADTFPGIFSGYNLSVHESHQAGKADTSGTAKAMVDYFNQMGVDFAAEDIVKERDPANQRDQWGIPESFLTGHGWHTYRLTSADGTVTFEFKHNVNGRDIYAAGTMDAVCYLARQLKAGRKGQVFNMIDVLKAG